MLQGNSRQPGRLGKNKRLSDAWLTLPLPDISNTVGPVKSHAIPISAAVPSFGKTVR
jgi:hypothetical protein